MRDLRWKLRVFSWRIMALIPLLILAAACDYRERRAAIEAERARCLRMIATAPTVEVAEEIAADCNLHLERWRR